MNIIQKPHILLVEDTLVIQTAMLQLLDSLACGTTLAETGRAAVECMGLDIHYDLILMDIRLPDTNGIAVTRVIRMRGFQLPIIALTSESHVIEARCLKAGMNAFFQKPITILTLKKILYRWIPDFSIRCCS